MSDKYISVEDQKLVKASLENYIEAFLQNSALVKDNPKSVHLLNLGIVSFIKTIAVNLDNIINQVKAEHPNDPYKLNIHGKTFENHLDFFIYMLQHATSVKEYGGN